MNTTGPSALTRVVNINNISYIKLPSEKLNPYNICDTEYNNPGTLMKPLEGSSWVSGMGYVWQSCYCQSDYITASIYIIILLLIISYILKIYK